MIGLGVAVVLLLWTFVAGFRTAAADTTGVLLLTARFMIVWMALTLVLVIQMTVMTKRILRVIDLASRKGNNLPD